MEQMGEEEERLPAEDLDAELVVAEEEPGARQVEEDAAAEEEDA